jgi:hypothetical protein
LDGYGQAARSRHPGASHHNRVKDCNGRNT